MYPIERLADIRALEMFLGITDGNIHRPPYQRPVVIRNDEPETGEVLYSWRFNPETWEMEIVPNEPAPAPA